MIKATQDASPIPYYKPADRRPLLRGSMTALVTPFRGGQIDWDTLDQLVERQVEGGTDWVVACGTTGESPTLTADEHIDVIQAVIAQADGRCRIMAGTGTNCTRESVRRTAEAARLGVDAALIVAPYYNRPNAEGLFRHYAAIADSVDLPLVVYNVPARTGVSVPNDVVVRLRQTYPHVAGLKHATGSVDGVPDLLSRCDIAVLSGDDAITWPMMSLGAVGVISVISNLVPGWMKSLVTAALMGDSTSASAHHRRVEELAEGLGRFGPNPLPIKTAMALRGLLEPEFRLPLCPLEEPAVQAIELLLQRLEVLPPVLT